MKVKIDAKKQQPKDLNRTNQYWIKKNNLKQVKIRLDRINVDQICVMGTSELPPPPPPPPPPSSKPPQSTFKHGFSMCLNCGTYDLGAVDNWLSKPVCCDMKDPQKFVECIAMIANSLSQQQTPMTTTAATSHGLAVQPKKIKPTGQLSSVAINGAASATM